MICERCHGNHYVRYEFTCEDGRPVAVIEPCPSCIGGVAHCCDGDQPSARDLEIDKRRGEIACRTQD